MKAGGREWVGLGVLALPTLLVTMDLSVLFLAVPKLTRALHPSSSELLWSTDVYGLMIATLAPSALALIRNMFDDPDQRQFAIAIWTSCFAAGAGVTDPP